MAVDVENYNYTKTCGRSLLNYGIIKNWIVYFYDDSYYFQLTEMNVIFVLRQIKLVSFNL